MIHWPEHACPHDERNSRASIEKDAGILGGGVTITRDP